MADIERNERLAKWMGWEYSPQERSWINPRTRVRQPKPPAYDINPAAALELLGWIRAQDKSIKRRFQNALREALDEWRENQDAASFERYIDFSWWLVFYAGLDVIAEAAEAVRKLEGE